MGFVNTGTVCSVFFCGFFVLLAAVSPENSEIHSLTYIYTAFSMKPELPGFHKFTAEGQLDGSVIDSFNSDGATKIPRQPWMKSNLPESYWTRGTDTRKSKQQWFDVNIGILKERLRQNDSDFHTLQWLHGCKAKRGEDGKLHLHRALDTYSYDGKDFLSFDDVNDIWFSSNDAAKETIRKWEQVSTLKVYTKSYLESDCLRWMNDFLGYRQKFLEETDPPEVTIYAAKSHMESNVRLTCFATGFYLKDVELRMRRNGEIIDELMGLRSSGVRPNHDNRYQRKDFVEIFKSDESQFTCEVVHAPSSLHVTKVWDHALPSESSMVLIIVASIIPLVVLVVAFVLIILYKKKKIGFPCASGSDKDSNPSMSSSQSFPDSDEKDDNDVPLMTSPSKGSDPSLSSSQSTGSNDMADSKSEEGEKMLKEPKLSVNGSDSGVSTSSIEVKDETSAGRASPVA